ncbi:hypothetical protein CASFOL_029200 [Castilleja foliolosa]|uniref:Uncharacterized protein n=1 Tax=Castilleja foliolosa TaxID=1961234 RepID=A0ABD3CE46_9LAMI
MAAARWRWAVLRQRVAWGNDDWAWLVAAEFGRVMVATGRGSRRSNGEGRLVGGGVGATPDLLGVMATGCWGSAENGGDVDAYWLRRWARGRERCW